jgi:S1-C subfamily serine protease
MARGDIIESINGTRVRSARDALARIAGRQPGSTLQLGALRGGIPLSFELEVAETPQRQ